MPEILSGLEEKKKAYPGVIAPIVFVFFKIPVLLPGARVKTQAPFGRVLGEWGPRLMKTHIGLLPFLPPSGPAL